MIRSRQDSGIQFRDELLDPIVDRPGGTEFTEDLNFEITQDRERTNQEIIGGAVEDTVEAASEVPKWFESMSQRTNEALIDWSSKLDKAVETAGQKAEDNIIETKVTGYFTKFGRWIQKPVNMGILGAVLFGLWYFKK